MMCPVRTKISLRIVRHSRLRRWDAHITAALCAVLLINLLACSDEPEPVQLYSFERPEKVALACFKIVEKGGKTTATPRPLKDCRDKEEDDKEHLHALVTQTSRGEIAVVDLMKSKSGVIDTREDIPGITFVPVGEIPKAIVVPTQDKKCEKTYVANFGSRDILWLPTDSFRPDSKSTTPILHRKSLDGRPVDMVLSPDENFLYVTVPDLSAVLRLTICNESVAEDNPRCTRNDDGSIDEDDYGSIIKVETLRLPEYQYDELREIQAAIPANARIEQQTYQYSCNYTFSSPTEDAIQRDFADLFACVPLESTDGGVSENSGGDQAIADASFVIDASVESVLPTQGDSGSDSGLSTSPDEAVPDDEPVLECGSVAPTPTVMAIDKIDDNRYRLLIADEALPVIHVIEINSDEPDRFARLISRETELPPPIVTGVPIRDLVVTPQVPKVIPGIEPTLDTDSGSPSEAAPDIDDSPDAEAEADFDAGVPLDASPEAGSDGGEDAAIETEPAVESEIESEIESEETSVENEAKYIYAIDDLDGSVLVVDAVTGAVLTTHSQQWEQQDRIPLGDAVAVTLEIIASTPKSGPELDEFIEDWCKCGITDETAPPPNRLYGVYLAVATTDGQIRIVDVHDMNAVALRECRHIACIEDGKRAFEKDTSGNIDLDEDENASYVLDVAEKKRYAADFCSTDKKKSCSIGRESDEYYEIDDKDNIECNACCIKDDKGDASQNTIFDRNEIEYNSEFCTQCLGPDGTPIDFDRDRCQRCANDEGDDIALAVRRHFPRLRYVGGTGAPTSSASFIVDEKKQIVRETGKSSGVEIHGLVGIKCDSDFAMAQSFPDPRDVAKKVDYDVLEDEQATSDTENNAEGAADAGGVESEEPIEEDFVHQTGNAFVCAGTNPWSLNGANWIVRYEGTVQGARGSDGKFVDKNDEEEYVEGEGDETIEFRSGDTNFCRSGVLGAEDIKPKYITITSDLPTVEEVRNARENTTGETPDDEQATGSPSNPAVSEFTAEDCALLQPPLFFSINDNSDGRLLEPQGESEKGLFAYCVAIASKVYSYQVLTESLSLVPGHAFVHGHFVKPDLTDPAAPLEFIGEADLEGISGDMLVITAPPQDDSTIEVAYAQNKNQYEVEKHFEIDDCEKLTKSLSDGYLPRVAFPIEKAYEYRLVIKPGLIAAQGPEELPRKSRTYEFIRYCMAHMLMKFEVRVQNAYTVLSTIPNYTHDVTVSDDKRCQPGSDPLRNSRAYERIEFRNRDIAFKLAAQETRTRGLTLSIEVPPVYKVAVDLGSLGYPYADFGNLPVSVVYDELYNKILVVDMGLRGLVSIAIENGFPDSLSSGAAVRYQ